MLTDTVRMVKKIKQWLDIEANEFKVRRMEGRSSERPGYFLNIGMAKTYLEYAQKYLEEAQKEFEKDKQ